LHVFASADFQLSVTCHQMRGLSILMGVARREALKNLMLGISQKKGRLWHPFSRISFVRAHLPVGWGRTYLGMLGKIV